MKNNSLFLVLSFYGFIYGQESKNEISENVLINQVKEKGLDFDQEKQACKIHNNDLPFAMCQDFINFLKTSKHEIGETQNLGKLKQNATFLNGDRILKNNAAFLLSEAGRIKYLQIDFKNLPKFNNKADFENYLEQLWKEKNLDTQLSSGKFILHLGNLNFLNDDNSQAFIEIIEKKCQANNKITDNLLLFGTTLKNLEISKSFSNFFNRRYTLSKSQEYVINNSKISYSKNNCSIDDISYPNQICTKALGFLAAINEFKKNESSLKKDGTIVDNSSNTNHNGTSRILLYGKPGNGKTTIGEVFAKIFNADLIFMDSASLFEKHYGETEKQIQDHFDRAKESLMLKKKVVLLIDEIDSIGYSQDKVNSEGAPKVANKLQTCIDEINKFPNSNQMIIIATTNRKHALSAPIESRFSSKVEIVKPKDKDIANKIINMFEKQDIEVNKEILLKAIKASRNFRDCNFCAEEIINSNLISSSDPKELAENYKDCISSLQNTYKERFWEVVNKTSDGCNKFNPIINTATSIFYLLDRSNSIVWTILNRNKKNDKNAQENKNDNLDLENKHDESENN